MNPLKQLETCGQAVWLDYLKRSLMEKGELKILIDRDGLKGITSNPSIFEKAIGESDEYADAIKQFQAKGDHSVSEIYEHLAIADIRSAADLLRPVYDKTQGRDGYVSLECSPYLADDTQATINEAKRLWVAVDRPNLMVKVPATPAGVPAIQVLIGEGLNINITLLFSVEVYEQVVEAYLAGLETLHRKGGDVAKIASVASFFVSRIDSAVEKQLDQLNDKTEAERFRGTVAIANAKVAYGRYKALFAGSRWEKLGAAGAKTQRLLWASTSTKNKAYKDTMYVEALVGKDSVDTIPPATMDAFRDHGTVQGDAIEQDTAAAKALLADLKQQNISLKAITDALVVEGVKLFADAFDELLGAVARRRAGLLEGDHPVQTIKAGAKDLEKAIADESDVWRKDGHIRKLWAHDKSVWSKNDEDKWLGWLTIVDEELADIATLTDFAQTVKREGFTDVVLLGMGGSSLGPEVLSETFGHHAGWPHFHMLDSTDPAQIKTLEQGIDIAKSLFIVSSKSGSTLEPNIFMDYFFDRVGEALGADKAGAHFVAVTDPGSSLDKHAKQSGFAHIFYGVPSIGGRYSVLSKFGLVPGAATGLDIKRLLNTTQGMVHACGADVPPAENPGVQLGLAMGVAAKRSGRDKVTIIASPGIATLGGWLEQLIAESTGKHGHGLIPVAAEPVTAPGDYGKDRFFAYLELEGGIDPLQRAAVAALERAGHPVAWIGVKDIWHIGQEFFRWEIAVAVAGAVLGINPFDQPDVEASKNKTRALTEAYEKTQTFPKQEPIFRENGLALYADPKNEAALGRHNTLTGYLKSHFGRVKAGDYVAFLAYIERNDSNTEALTNMRVRVRDNLHAATCVGFGPRFQHSTGQAYKGGPNSGVFLQLTCDDPADLDVPGHAYSFGVVKAAQAQGDLGVLEERDRRVVRIHLKNVKTGLADLSRAIDSALSQ